MKNGASANAVEIYESKNDERDENLLLIQCWLDANYEYDELSDGEIEDNCFIKLLKIFIENGFNIDKYVNDLLENIHFIYNEKQYIDMTKIILNKLKNKKYLDSEDVLSNISIDESACYCDGEPKQANELSTIYEMIDGYTKGKDVNKFFNYEKVIGQRIKNINIYCDDLKVDFSNKMIAKGIDIFIECENDTLTIKGKYIFVDNNKAKSDLEKLYEGNRFETQLKKSIIDKKITKIELLNEEICAKQKEEKNITKIVITLDNNKKVTIDADEALTNMKITIG